MYDPHLSTCLAHTASYMNMFIYLRTLPPSTGKTRLPDLLDLGHDAAHRLGAFVAVPARAEDPP